MNLQDVRLLIHWMENPAVTRYLNEDPDIVSGLRQLADMVPEPMLTCHFNRIGRFFMACTREGEPVGFVKLREQGGAPMKLFMPSGMNSCGDGAMAPARCAPRWQRPFCSAGHGGSLPGFTRKICGQSVPWPPAASAAWKQDSCTDMKLPCRTI